MAFFHIFNPERNTTPQQSLDMYAKGRATFGSGSVKIYQTFALSSSRLQNCLERFIFGEFFYVVPRYVVWGGGM